MAATTATFAASLSQAMVGVAGNTYTVFAFCQASTGAFTGCSDGGADTFTQRQLNASTGLHVAVYDVSSIAGGSVTITVTHSGIVSASCMYIFQTSGLAASPYDTGSTGAASTGAIVTDSFTPAGAGEVILAAAAALTASNVNLTPGSGYSLDSTNGWGLSANSSSGGEHTLSGAAGAQTAGFGPSVTVVNSIAVVAYAVPAAATLLNGLTLLGTG